LAVERCDALIFFEAWPAFFFGLDRSQGARAFLALPANAWHCIRLRAESYNAPYSELSSPERVSLAHRVTGGMAMGRGLLLWLIGIPLPIILLIWLFGGLS
jgi:hypothetical protein